MAATGCSDPPDPPQDPPAVPVRSEVCKRAPFQASLVLLGTVRAAQTVPLVPVAGTISYPARFASGLRTGETVAAGETLAILTNEQDRHALTEAKLQAESAETRRARLQRGRDQGVISSADFDQADIDARLARERLQSAQRSTEQAALAAPRSGRLVVEKPVPPGSRVEGHDAIAEIAVDGAPLVEALAPASERKLLRPGLDVALVAPGTSEVRARGRLVEVASVVDAAGTVRVVAEVAASDDPPVPGEGVELRVALESKGDVLTVPEEAIVVGSAGPSVFVLEPSPIAAGKLRPRRAPIQTGMRGDGRVEVWSGIKEGERVAVAGAALLDERSLAVDTAASAR